MKSFISIMGTILFSNLFAQTDTAVIIPNFTDAYSKTVAKLEAGETDIDYLEFRYNFIESQQFKIANSYSATIDSLKKEMYRLMDSSDYKSLIYVTKKILSIDYTDMRAHKILRQSYELLGDTILAKKYKAIQFGLLKSIVQTGDGKSCETAWPVITIEEEYFVLDMINADFQKQELITEGGICDKMTVKIDGKKKTYYFDVVKVFEGRKNLEKD